MTKGPGLSEGRRAAEGAAEAESDMKSKDDDTSIKPAIILEADDIESLVVDIRQVANQAALCAALSIGKLVVDRIFGGDIRALHRSESSHVSFRQLASHPDLDMSRTALRRAVSVYEMWVRLGEHEVWQRLRYKHFCAVLGLPPAHQQELLERASAEDWSARELETRARTARLTDTTGGSVSAGSVAASVDTALGKMSKRCSEIADSLRLTDHPLNDRRLEKARCQAARVRELSTEIENLLAKRKPD